MALIILKQAVIMLLLILLGMLCRKIGMLSDQGVKDLSALVLQVVNPVVILMAYRRELEMALVKNLLWALLLSALAMAAGILAARLLLHPKDAGKTAIARVSAVYSNCGFMGIPLVNALLGYEGVFYLTAFLTVFNVLVWTHGVMTVSGQRSFRSLMKVLKSPAILAVAAGMMIFFLQIPLPKLLVDTLSHISNMNTPLAMLAAGATIMQTNLGRAVRQPQHYWVAAVKLLLLPLLALLLFLPLPVASIVKTTVVLAMAAPTAVTCTLQAIHYKQDANYAAELFAMTTLLSVITLPCVGILLEKVEI